MLRLLYVFLNTCVAIFASKMFEYPSDFYKYEDLPDPPPPCFRVAELLPGEDGDPVSCLLHIADLSKSPEYEALLGVT